MALAIALLSLAITLDAFQSDNVLAGWGWAIIAFYASYRVYADGFSNKRYRRSE